MANWGEDYSGDVEAQATAIERAKAIVVNGENLGIAEDVIVDPIEDGHHWVRCWVFIPAEETDN